MWCRYAESGYYLPPGRAVGGVAGCSYACSYARWSRRVVGGVSCHVATWRVWLLARRRGRERVSEPWPRSWLARVGARVVARASSTAARQGGVAWRAVTAATRVASRSGGGAATRVARGPVLARRPRQHRPITRCGRVTRPCRPDAPGWPLLHEPVRRGHLHHTRGYGHHGARARGQAPTPASPRAGTMASQRPRRHAPGCLPDALRRSLSHELVPRDVIASTRVSHAHSAPGGRAGAFRRARGS